MATPEQNLLDPTTLSQAEQLGLAARHVVEGFMSGEHKSPFRGFSIEFTQHREYVPGDDTKHLDWKVLGRTDRYMLKQYEQETNYVAQILLDGSESMRYGSGIKGGGRAAANTSAATSAMSKFDYAKTLAACLSYLILHQRDAVSLALFDDGVIQKHIQRTGNLASIHNIMATLAAFNPSAKTNVGDVLHQLAGTTKRKGIVILISDLFDDEAKVLDGIQHLRFGGQEVIVFHVMDPYELEFPFDGNVEFEGLEQTSNFKTRPHDIRKTYMRELEAFKTRVSEGCERNSTHYLLVDTSKPLHEVLSGYLAFRQRTTAR